MEHINDYIKGMIEGVQIVPECNGGLTIKVQDRADIPAVLARIADAMSDWELLDLQITTYPSRFEVFIQELDSPDEGDGFDKDLSEGEEPEDPELWPADEIPMEERPVPIKKGDIICYRPNIVKVLQVLKTGARVEGPYREVQTIDWEDIKQYNPFRREEEEEE